MAGVRYNQFVGIIEALTFGILIVLYGTIWIRIRRSSKLIDAKIERCNRSAKIMTIFLVTFMLQWSPQIVFVVCYAIGKVPQFLPIITSCVIGLGGVFDFAAYAIIRIKFTNQVCPR